MVLDTTIVSELEEVSKLHALSQDEGADVVSAFADLRSTRSYLDTLIARRDHLFSALGVPDTESLVCLKQSPFLQKHMNALAVKHRLSDKLRQRKFENERLERAYRRTVNGMFFIFWICSIVLSNIQSPNTINTLLDPCSAVNQQFKSSHRSIMNCVEIWLT